MPDVAVPASPAPGISIIPLGDKPYASPYTSVGQEICENLYLEASPSSNSTTPYYFVSIPGMERFIRSTAKTSVGCRGLYTAGNGNCYGAWGNKFYRINSDGTRTLYGELETYTGPVRMCDNSTDLIVVDGSYGYNMALSATSIEKITDEYFPGVADNDVTKGPTHVVSIDTYFLVNRSNSNEYYWSTPGYVPTSFNADDETDTHLWNGLNFGVKIGDSDNIIAMAKSVNLLWLFGKTSIEVHYDSGDYNGQLFTRQGSGLINFGCNAPNSVVSLANNVFWLGTDRTGAIGVFTASTDFQPKKISTRGMESYLSAMTDFSDAIGYVYASDGHAFVCWHFPTGNQTWVFDITTETWHRRTFYNYSTGLSSAYKGLYSTFFNSQTLIGLRDSDAVMTLKDTHFVNDDPWYDDKPNYINRVKSTPVMFNNGLNTRYKSIQVIMQQGVGLNDTDYGYDPKLIVSWSDDAGKSWSNDREVSIGKLGVYDQRTRLTLLGSGRNRIWKVRCTEPVRVILAAFLCEYETRLR